MSSITNSSTNSSATLNNSSAALNTSNNNLIDSENDNQSLSQLLNISERCLQHVRALRMGVIRSHDFLSSGFNELCSETPKISITEYRTSLEKFAKDIVDEYDKLEIETKGLPWQIPSSIADHFDSLIDSTILDEDDSMENVRQAFNWMDLETTYGNYIYQFLKPQITRIRRGPSSLQSANSQRPEQPQMLTLVSQTPSNIPHRQFENDLCNFLKNLEGRMTFLGLDTNYRIQCHFLERGVLSSIIELKIVLIPAKYQTSNRHPVCLQKAAFMINNGTIEYTVLIAPHEDWRYIETSHWSQKQIDFSFGSRYEIYRRLTWQCNTYIALVTSQSNAFEFRAMSVFFSMLANTSLIDQPCRFCKKVLRDFSPTIRDVVKKYSYHLGCR